MLGMKVYQYPRLRARVTLYLREEEIRKAKTPSCRGGGREPSARLSPALSGARCVLRHRLGGHPTSSAAALGISLPAAPGPRPRTLSAAAAGPRGAKERGGPRPQAGTAWARALPVWLPRPWARGKEALARLPWPWALGDPRGCGHVQRAGSAPPGGSACPAARAGGGAEEGETSAGQAEAAAAHPPLPRLLSACFYGACSFLIVLVNKAVLTTYSFPSPMVLGIGQMATTVLILYVSKLNKIIHYPDFDKSIPVKLFPLPLLYVGNHISGLSSTSKLSLPMFTVLRKFTIPLTLLLEIIILGKRYSLGIIASVFAIILGAFIAAGSDLSFNLEGYIFVLLNDIFTAANGVYTKKKMDPKELGKYGVLFYNACFMVIPTMMVSFSTGDLQQATDFKHWTNFLFLFQFLLSCFLGFLLMYSTVLCSHYNSALMTTVVGAIKNISIAYIGMLVGGDYIFSILNFIGLNICMAGGLRYSFLTLREHSKPKQPTDEENRHLDSKS